MPKIKCKIYIFAWIFLTISCRTPKSSQNKQETDDRLTPITEALKDVTPEINTYINRQIQVARQEVNPDDTEWTHDLKLKFIHSVGLRLSKVRPGSGIGIHFSTFNLEVSTLTEIEAYLIDTLKAENNQIHFTKFADSRYADNPIGPGKALVISHMSQKSADHSISPVIRIGNSIIGLDKLGHFTEQGYWYFQAEKSALLQGEIERLQFGQFMEGSPELSPSLFPKYKKIYGTYCRVCILLGGFGYYGTASTGVSSSADMNANEDGYFFFERLYQDPATYNFDIRTFDVDRWNETTSKNYYKEGLKVRP